MEYILDSIAEENKAKARISQSLIKTKIEIRCDGELIETCTLDKFLSDNQYQEWLVEKCRKLATEDEIVMCELSGLWRIKKVS